MKKSRAKKIATTLGDASKWHSHGRGISLNELGGTDIKLIIDDFGSDAALGEKIKTIMALRSITTQTKWAYLDTSILNLASGAVFVKQVVR